MSNELELKEEENQKFEDLYFNKLGMCGCGMPNSVKKFLYELLLNHKSYKDQKIEYQQMVDKRKEIIKSVDPDVIFEIIFHLFDHNGLMEHGGSVYSAWFTDDGEDFIKLLSKNIKDLEVSV